MKNQAGPAGRKTPKTPPAQAASPEATAARNAMASPTARWGALTATLGVILLDISELNAMAGDPAMARIQQLDVQQAHAMLARLLESRPTQTDAVSAAKAPAPGFPALTPRQHDILREVAAGKSNVEIAQALHIGLETVKTHIRQILMRLDARNRTELAAIFQRTVDHGGSGLKR